MSAQANTQVRPYMCGYVTAVPNEPKISRFQVGEAFERGSAFVQEMGESWREAGIVLISREERIGLEGFRFGFYW